MSKACKLTDYRKEQLKRLSHIPKCLFLVVGSWIDQNTLRSVVDRDTKRDVIYELTELYSPDRYALYIIDYDPEDNNNDNITVHTAGKIPLAEKPFMIAVNDHTKMAYVSNLYSDSVSVIDLYTEKIIANVPVGHGPVGISINSRNKKISEYYNKITDKKVSKISQDNNSTNHPIKKKSPI
jgi:YVTN family beta-propeller protein